MVTNKWLPRQLTNEHVGHISPQIKPAVISEYEKIWDRFPENKQNSIADYLIRKYVNALLSKNPEEASAIINEMMDYVHTTKQLTEEENNEQLDTLIMVLPYVEDLSDSGYKSGAINKVLRKMRTVIEKSQTST
jgi:hypothetical protein